MFDFSKSQNWFDVFTFSQTNSVGDRRLPPKYWSPLSLSLFLSFFLSFCLSRSQSVCWTLTSTARRFPNWWTWRETRSSLTVRHIVDLCIYIHNFKYFLNDWCEYLCSQETVEVSDKCDEASVPVIRLQLFFFFASRQSDDPTHQLWDSLVSHHISPLLSELPV